MTNISIPEKAFILIRHAETEANTKEIACGLMDSPLTPRGIYQAERLGKNLQKNISGKVSIIHSELQRSIDTAKIIARFLDVEDTTADPEMNEHAFGDWEGVPWHDVLHRLNKGENPPGGESRAAYRTRIINCFSRILTDSKDDTVLIIVAHGGTFYALASFYGFYPKEVENCGAVHFIPSSNVNICKWIIRKINHHDATWVNSSLFLQEV